MNADVQTFALQILASAGVAWLAASLTARFSLARFRKEKTWERKAAAYTTILEALGDLFAWFDKNLDAHYGQSELSEAMRNDLGAAFSKAHKEMTRTIAGQVWLLDPSVGSSIKLMNKTLDDEDFPDWHSHLEYGYGAVKKARDDITAFARRDLNIDDRTAWKRMADSMNTPVGVKRHVA